MEIYKPKYTESCAGRHDSLICISFNKVLTPYSVMKISGIYLINNLTELVVATQGTPSTDTAFPLLC